MCIRDSACAVPTHAHGMPRSPVACQSPASRPPVVRQSIASRSPAQPLASRTPATRQPLACCSLVALLKADGQVSFAPPPRHADECSAPSSTHQASIRFACRWLSRTPAARLPLARLPLGCHSPVARQCWMSGAPPAAHQPSASCSLAPCQLRACRSSVARQSLCQSLWLLFRSGVAPLLQVKGGPVHAISACCSVDAPPVRFRAGLLVTLASRCQGAVATP